MRIVLLRHGNEKDDHLTLLGKKQVKLICHELKQFDFDQIICSPTSRCKETADIVCKNMRRTYKVDNRLNERFYLDKIIETKEEQDWWDNYLNVDFHSPLPDDFASYYKRHSEAFDYYIKQNNPQKDILFVIHSAATYAFLRYHGKLSETIWQSVGQGTYVCYELNRPRQPRVSNKKKK